MRTGTQSENVHDRVRPSSSRTHRARTPAPRLIFPMQENKGSFSGKIKPSPEKRPTDTASSISNEKLAGYPVIPQQSPLGNEPSSLYGHTQLLSCFVVPHLLNKQDKDHQTTEESPPHLEGKIKINKVKKRKLVETGTILVKEDNFKEIIFNTSIELRSCIHLIKAQDY